VYYEGVPTVVAFEISPTYVKAFHHCPQRLKSHPYTVRRLRVGSAEPEDQQVRSHHLVQVQSPISTAGTHIYEHGLHLKCRVQECAR
jgi:hypothetical protein